MTNYRETMMGMKVIFNITLVENVKNQGKRCFSEIITHGFCDFKLNLLSAASPKATHLKAAFASHKHLLSANSATMS